MAARRWEYKVVQLEVSAAERETQEKYERYLNEMGVDGWELCGVHMPRGRLTIVLHWKRPDDWESEHG